MNVLKDSLKLEQMMNKYFAFNFLPKDENLLPVRLFFFHRDIENTISHALSRKSPVFSLKSIS